MEDSELCLQCGHPFDPHAIISTTGDPVDGGIMLCPRVDCQCYSTWGLDGGEARRIPDRVEVEIIREQIQREGS
ncbi:hypothetical protein [Rhizocola hellebori]|uniref:hypothetical protein n=1 Tax=Rhizocola hellebori TaxID=1392758 RepID=UPI0019442C4C|nr:hypothetical protein [Rhizocola hellebori]